MQSQARGGGTLILGLQYRPKGRSRRSWSRSRSGSARTRIDIVVLQRRGESIFGSLTMALDDDAVSDKIMISNVKSSWWLATLVVPAHGRAQFRAASCSSPALLARSRASSMLGAYGIFQRPQRRSWREAYRAGTGSQGHSRQCALRRGSSKQTSPEAAVVKSGHSEECGRAARRAAKSASRSI